MAAGVEAEVAVAEALLVGVAICVPLVDGAAEREAVIEEVGAAVLEGVFVWAEGVPAGELVAGAVALAVRLAVGVPDIVAAAVAVDEWLTPDGRWLADADNVPLLVTDAVAAALGDVAALLVAVAAADIDAVMAALADAIAVHEAVREAVLAGERGAVGEAETATLSGTAKTTL